MKSWLIISLLAALGSLPMHVSGQCSPQVHGMVFSFGITDSITPALYEPGPYYVCDNATLYYYGNNPDTVYLEGSARLKVGYSFNLVVYMRNNAALIMDTATANWQSSRIIHVYHDTLYTYFQDTAGVQIQGLTACTAMTYDYSLFPNSVSPCSMPSANASAAITDQAIVEVFPNPAFSELNLELTDPRQTASRLLLMDVHGKILRSETFRGDAVRWDISSYPRGIYLLGIESDAGLKWQRVSFL